MSQPKPHGVHERSREYVGNVVGSPTGASKEKASSIWTGDVHVVACKMRMVSTSKSHSR